MQKSQMGSETVKSVSPVKREMGATTPTNEPLTPILKKKDTLANESFYSGVLPSGRLGNLTTIEDKSNQKRENTPTPVKTT